MARMHNTIQNYMNHGVKLAIIQRLTLRSIFLLTLGLSVFGLPILGSAHAEKIAFTKQGVTVWKVPVANSDMIGFKAQTVLDVPIGSAYATIIDIDHASEWLPNVGNITALAMGADGKSPSKIHFVIDMPFPLTDRHLAVKSKVSRDVQGTISINNTVDNSVRFSNNNLVRITDYRGGWKLEPISATQTRVTIDGYADPAGSIPPWVANMFVTQQPFDMLKNMKSQVKKVRYKNTTVPF